MKKIILICLIALLSMCTKSQDFYWSHNGGTPPQFSIMIVSITNVNNNVFTANVVIENPAFEDVTSRGIVYATTPNPSYPSNARAYGSGDAPFSVNSGTLTGNTTYYVRAYALIGGSVFKYSEQVIVTTPATPTVPTPIVYTERFVTDFGANSVTVKGYIENYLTLGSYLVEYGICFRVKDGNLPTVSDFKVPSTNYINITIYEAGTFTSSLTGLQEFQEYTARAYVTTTAGTTYGTVVDHSSNHYNHYARATAIHFRPSNLYVGRQTQGGYVLPQPTSTDLIYALKKDNYQRVYIMCPGILSIGGVTKFNYTDALQHCENLAYGGYTDWVLNYAPQQIIDLKNAQPSIFVGFPTNDDYWSKSELSEGNKTVFSLRTDAIGYSYYVNMKYVIPMRIY